MAEQNAGAKRFQSAWCQVYQRLEWHRKWNFEQAKCIGRACVVGITRCCLTEIPKNHKIALK